MEENEIIQKYKHRLRIFLIIYVFSDDYQDEKRPAYKKLLQSEIKIQKIDFWLRNPDYFAYELLKLVKENPDKRTEIKLIVKDIFNSKEPEIRREEMEKFRFGAYQDLDDVIAFLSSVDLVKFESKRAIDSKVRNKKYFLTELALKKLNENINSLSFLQWYFDRCNLIKKYFGDKTGSQLKDIQYELDEYKTTSFNDYIAGISEFAKDEYQKIYHEKL
ncbi:MAG: hypothetical protein H6577_23665 [Lewinellaceae bacterium]|nr:hypothetical protein [Saprospiraceae bacterium]MCB9341136.1 hypothetical protein [Lewinellaceae bacterium]